ncbi:hypothetical protein [Streptomyces sp. NPDC003943]
MTENQLFIPIDDAADTDGTRPWPPNATTPAYANANIRISSSFGTDTKAYAGRDNNVIVRVKNRGPETRKNVSVQAWLFDPGIGMSSPGDAVKRFGNAGNPQDIKKDELVTFFMTPVWHPDPTELGGEPQKHFCLMANTFQQGGGEGQEVPVTSTEPLHPDKDPHHGQCNIMLVPAPQGGGGGTSKNIPTTTYPPPEFAAATLGASTRYLVRADHVTTKPDAGQLDVLRTHSGIVPNGDGTSVGGLSLMTSRGPVPITLSSVAPGFDLRSELIPGLDTPFTFAEGRPNKIPTDIVVRLPEGAPIGSLHVFDLGLWTDRGDMVGSGLRIMTLVTE